MISSEPYLSTSAEGLLTNAILLAKFAEPSQRHIISVFKLVQDLLEPSQTPGKSYFQQLMQRLPSKPKPTFHFKGLKSQNAFCLRGQYSIQTSELKNTSALT